MNPQEVIPGRVQKVPMNIVKGIDRIAIVLAIVSILPGFIWGWDIYKNKIMANIVRWNEVHTEQLLEDHNAVPSPRLVFEEPVYPAAKRYGFVHKVSGWECAVAGIAGSSIAALIVLLSIHGFAWILLWIVEGFKDEGDIEE